MRNGIWLTRVGVLGCSLVLVPVDSEGRARGSVPAPVSPGAENVATSVEARCPTFSWAGTAGSSGYRLAVFRLEADDAQEPELVALVELPADSRGFTPALGQCLDRGESYAWSVAAVTGEGVVDAALEWSPAFLFEVASADEVGEVESVEQAVAVLERYLARRGAQGEADLVRPDDATAARRGGGAAAPREVRRDLETRAGRGRIEELEDERDVRAKERAEDLDGVVRVAAAAAPVPGAVSLNVSNQVHLASASAVFKAGEAFLWDDTAGNTALGREALESVTDGVSNTAVGRDALRANSGGEAFSGSFNTAVGDEALLANTSGKRNTGLGSDALRANTTGFGNTAVGATALQSNVEGEHNVAVGAYALRANTEGSSNTAVGLYALRATTDGDENTAVGHEALQSSTKGRQTAIGARALASSTTGEANVALGFQALQSSVVGDGNTAVGYQALVNSSGSGNVAIGYFAGVSSTTGSNNIFIGNLGHDEDGTIRIGASISHERTFIAGIRGKTTGASNAIPVVIDSSGQLGTVSSSRRTKRDIGGTEPFLDRLLELRPVAFRYRQHVASDPNAQVEFGLIAEEVAEVFPELVVFDQEGNPETVRYHLLSSLLLAELKEQHERLGELRRRLVALEGKGSRRQRDR